MARLKHIERYTFAFPREAFGYRKATTFSEGVRLRVQEFLTQKDGHLMSAFQWLLFEGWRKSENLKTWEITSCPWSDCDQTKITFVADGPTVLPCASCGRDVYLADALRLSERIDDELGAGAILSYLLTSLEQIVLVYIIKSVLEIKPALLREILFVKDGPLAFFGVTATLSKPMRGLMDHLVHDYQEPDIPCSGSRKAALLSNMRLRLSRH